MKTATFPIIIGFPLGASLPMYSLTMMGLRRSHLSLYGRLRNLSSGERGNKSLVAMMEDVLEERKTWMKGAYSEEVT